ncbi:MAG TPA: proton-conducting transporter membrane subunit [Chloroflexota bacterium]|nr:proton-conducting transporter membrane subunit [Chloroflexota bacterium]
MSDLQAAARDAILTALAFYGAGSLVGLLIPARRGAALAGFGLGILGCLAAMAGAILVWQGGTFEQSLVYWYGFGKAGLSVDTFAALFVLIVGGVGLPICLFAPDYLRRYGERYSPRAFAALLNLLLASVLICVTADNAFLFLVAWELIVLLFYLLVVYQYDQPDTPSAAYLTAALARGGGAMVVGALLLLAVSARGFSFAAIAAHASALPMGIRVAVFILALIGFGTKIGAVPAQIWLPPGYGTAPSAASAAMAGVALTAGFYGLARVLFTYLQPLPSWCGLVVLLAGAITAVVGILYGVAQADVKQFIAYSSVENGGIILIGIGLAALARSQDVMPLAALALLASLYHMLGHALAKALLFLGAGAVELGTGATGMESLGGLMARLPWTGITFLVGSLTLAALPPFSGFGSEWLTFQALLQGFRLGGSVNHVGIAVAGALLALTSGLALMAFINAVGIVFLGRPRSERAAQARETGVPVRAALAYLALASAAVGILGPWVVRLLADSQSPLLGVNVADRIVTDHLAIEPAYPNFSSADPFYLAFVLPLLLLAPLLLGVLAWRWGYHARQPARRLPAWSSGGGRTGPGISYTAIGYANPVRVIFTNFYRTRRVLEAEGDELFPHTLRYGSTVWPATERLIYQPLTLMTLFMAGMVRRLQSGYLSAYIAYMLIVLLIAVVAFTNWT